MNRLTRLGRNLISTFYGPESYARVAKEGGVWKGVRYALVAGLIGAAFVLAMMTPGIIKLAKMDVSPERITAAYPDKLEVAIKDGVASANVKQPYLFPMERIVPEEKRSDAEREKEPANLFAIDTTRDLTLEQVRAYDAVVVLGRKSLYARENEGGSEKITAHSLSAVKDMTINEKLAQDLVAKALPWVKAGFIALSVMLFFILVFGYALFQVFAAVFGALIVKLVAKMRGGSISYERAYLLALLALIPTTILTLLALSLGVPGGLFSLGVFTLIAVANVRK